MRRTGGWTRALGVGVAALLACAAGPAAGARAQEPGFEGPSLDQYVESVPSAEGGTAAPRRSPGAAGRLPAATRRQLRRQGGSSAAALERIATDPAFGAPPATGAAPASGGDDEPEPGRRPRATPARDGAGGSGGAGGPSGAGTVRESDPGALSAGAGALADAGATGPLALVALALIAAGAGAAAVRRRRAR